MSNQSHLPSNENHASPATTNSFDDNIDLRELFLRVGRGLPQILGLGLLGFVAAAVGMQLLSPIRETSSTTRIGFSFNGFERGQYPDKSKFQPDDIRAPEIISEAMTRVGLNVDEASQGRIRSAISIEAVIPATITNERDRLRASGQTPSPYIADEYAVKLVLPRSSELDKSKRERLLSEIVSVYREKFQQTYVDAPQELGNAFQSLHGADYFEYEFVLSSEIQRLAAFLQKQAMEAPTFRASSTSLTFSDLLHSTELFAQLRLNEALGLIRAHGVSRDRQLAMIKMDYHLSRLEDRERQALEEEQVIVNLMQRTQERSQNYVLGVKSQAQQPQQGSPILDQGLIDSLLQNDAYNFLMRRALEAGLIVKGIQAEKARLLERKKSMESFMADDRQTQTAVQAQLETTLKGLEEGYRELVNRIQRTYADFSRQEFADAVRISGQITTDSLIRSIAMAGIIGLALGMALGGGLSLLGIYVGPRQKPA